MKLIVRNIHKYLSFFISVQLLLWTVSGIYFAFNKIELVRGEQYRLTNFSDINLGEIDFDIPKTSNLEIKKRLDKTILILSSDSGSSYLNSDGTPLDKISSEMGMLLVQQNTTLIPIEAEEITSSKILQMINDGTITEGMIPKINACLDAVNNGVTAVGIINGTKKHSCLWEIFSDKGAGTLIRR